MELTKKQAEALDLTLRRYKAGEKYTVIAGYAGTGKSTVIRFIIAAFGAFNIDPDKDVAYVAPTGKAANELVKKGNKNATTLHKLLWDWKPLPNGTFLKQSKDSLNCKIVVCDETSMVSKEVINQLLKHNVYIIFAGDPGQLPPISKDDDNHLLDHPHIFLDEVMRQAMDSEIIRCCTQIRNGEQPNPADYGKDVMILPSNKLNTGMMTWADQILCATNNTRVALNNQMRTLLNHTSEFPEEGDKVICLHNEWDILDDDSNALVNGTIGWLKQPEQKRLYIPKFWGGGVIDVTYSHLTTELGTHFFNLPMDTKMINTGEKCLDAKLAYKIAKSHGKYDIDVPLEIAYGYCITTHKAQGAQWEKVLTIEENFPFSRNEHARWLYTACTRPSEKLVLIRNF